MKNSSFLVIFILLMSIIPTISFAGLANSTATSNSSTVYNNTLSITSIQASNSIATISNSSLKYINQSVVGKTFNNIMKPVSGYITYFVLIIFVIVLAYGLLEIYSEMNIEPEKKLKAMLEYILGSSSILLVAFVLYAYVGFFPQIVVSSAPNLIKIHGVLPIALIWFDLFVAVIISIFGFILAIRELLNFIRTFQPTLHEDTKEFERNSSLTRFFVLLAFAFFSPLIIGLIFVITTQVFFSVSNGISTALSKVAINTSQYNVVSATVYSANLPSCGANIFSGNFWTCLGSSLIYLIFSQAYTVGFEASILKTAINLMLSPFGSNVTFDVIYEIMVLILYVYGFIKIDWYSLEYVSSLKSGEREAYNYEKLKRAYIQYIGFIISPILFMISLILLNAFLSMLVSAMTSNNMYLIPPLLNINGVATADNLLIDFAGLVMILFAIILILFVIFLLLFRLIGGIVFAFGLFLYLSENYKYRAFGKNLIMGFIGIYLAPLILLLLYSFWFGFLPMAISHALGSSGLSAVQATVGQYTATPLNSTSSTIVINPGNVKVVCNNATSVYNALSNSNLDNSDARGALLAGCQNFVGYWGNGYIIMAFVSLVLLIIGFFGFGTIAGSIGGLIGVGGEGAESVFKGLHGKPLLQKMSKIASNMQKNRSRYLKSLAKKGGVGKVFGSIATERTKGMFGTALKVAGGIENVAYGVMTAPIAGTALGNVLDVTRQATKNVIAGAISKPEEYSYGKADDVLDAYAEKTKKPGESNKDARERAKKELAEKYGFVFDEKSKTFKVNNKNLKNFENDTGLHVKTSVSSFQELEGYDEAKKEYDKAEKEYEKVEKAYKSGKASKSKFEKAKQKRNEAKKTLDEIAKKGGYKNAEAYEDMKKLNDAYLDYQDALESGNEKKIAKAKDNFKNTVRDYEKKYGARINGAKIAKMMETSEGRMDARNIMATALSLQDPELSANFLSGAINGDKIVLARERFAVLGNGIGKAIKTEFVNPATTSLKERYYSVKDILGKMKNYNLVSGIGLIDQYNSEIKDLDKQFESAMNEYNKNLEILKDPKSDRKAKAEAEESIKILKANLDALVQKKKRLERSRSYLETPEMLVLSALNKKAIDELKLAEAKEGKIISTREAIHKLLESGAISSPFQVLDNLSKLASGDELGRINLTKAMLENELRIKKKAVVETEKELNKIKDALQDENLTESQKLQYKKMEEELTYKYSMLNSEVKRIELDSGELKNIIKSLKIIRKPIVVSSEYTLEKKLGNYIQHRIIENSELADLNNKKKLLLNEKENLKKVYDISDLIDREEFELVDSAINPESSQLINEMFSDDPDAKVISKISDFKLEIMTGKNAINALDKLGNEEAQKILDSVKTSLVSSLSELKERIDRSKNPEIVRKYENFVNSVADKLTIENLKNTNLNSLSNEIKKEFNDAGLGEFISSSQINDMIYNNLSDKTLTMKIYELHKNEFASISEKIKEHYNARLDQIEKEIQEIDKKETPPLKRAIAKIIYGPENKSVYTTDKDIIDREIANETVKNLLKSKAKEYNLEESTIAILSSFDHSINEIKDPMEREKAINFVNNEVIPAFGTLKNNTFAKVIYSYANDLKSNQKTGDLDNVFNSERLSRINDLEALETITKISSNKEDFLNLFTKPKNISKGNLQKKHTYSGVKIMHISEKAESTDSGQTQLGEHWGVFRGAQQNESNEDEDNEREEESDE